MTRRGELSGDAVIQIFTVDAFSERPFSGNPAGVCLLDREYPDEWMRSVAAEMRHSETAFVLGESDRVGLRWFSPLIEVDLCGHATLAAAHVLFGIVPTLGEIAFHTRSGVLHARKDGELLVLDFPSRPVEPIATPAGLSEVLGCSPIFVGRSDATWMAVLTDAAAVRECSVDLGALMQLPVRSLVITALSDTTDSVDFVSRYFRPIDGIPEDPVTGSAHCILGPYWGEVLGKDELVGYQASERGGSVIVRLRGDRVDLAGKAVTITAGELFPG